MALYVSRKEPVSISYWKRSLKTHESKGSLGICAMESAFQAFPARKNGVKPGLCQEIVSLATFMLLDDMVLAQQHLKPGSYLYVETYDTSWYGEVTRSDTSRSPSLIIHIPTGGYQSRCVIFRNKNAG